MLRLFRRRQAEEAPAQAQPGEAAAGAPPAQAETVPQAELEQALQEERERTEEALQRTKRTWFGRLARTFERSQIDEELWEELEEILIGADTGVETALRILDRVRDRVRREGLKRPEEARAALKEELVALLESARSEGRLFGPQAAPPLPKPAVVLVVGVNGTGKTTSIAKLAHLARQEGYAVLLAAADTFRAAAIDQLRIWGQRVGVDVIAHQPGADPGAVAFDALAAAAKRGTDLVLVDTAGRLHTKQNLMQELQKIRRVVERKDPTAPHEVLLVMDATTGQNGLSQARTFTEAVGVTGIFLAKLDGTAKGGIVFAIADELGLPVRFVGTGERPDDIALFDARSFVDALFD